MAVSKGKLLAVAAAGMLSAVALSGCSSTGSGVGLNCPKHMSACKGMNSCKGKNSCKGMHGCKGSHK